MPRILIIGAGFSGLCLAIQLKKAGFPDFTILEKADRLGGTWRENTYPGAACDVPSFLYSFSFEPKTDWSRKWSPQPEILAYMEHCAEKYAVLPHVRFGTEVASARFDAEAGVWNVRTSAGESLQAEVLVSGVGQLHRPVLPDIPGLGDFEGVHFHSACWDHGVDLTGKRVAVVGSAASAIQFIPEIARTAGEVRVFQRTPNWMIPRGDRAYGEAEKQRFARLPWLARLYRWSLWLRAELLLYPMIRGRRWAQRMFEKVGRAYLRETIADPSLRKALTPDYPVGAKRVLISDDYYAALARDDVHLVTGSIERLTPTGIRTSDGALHEADVVIFATGFDTNAFLAPMKIEGLDGASLHGCWRDGAEAYLGLSVSGFPNFFMMYGPNTNLGHNSIIFMIECQTRYVIDCVKRIQRKELRYLDVRRDVVEAYNRQMQRELDETVWARIDSSWYKTSQGRITNNWSSSTFRYWWKTRQVDFGAYEEVT